jgi:hypothetical protein
LRIAVKDNVISHTLSPGNCMIKEYHHFFMLTAVARWCAQERTAGTT